MFVTYALFSAKHNKIYIGFTSDLISRFHSHNQFATKGFTKNFRPWIVVYVEFFNLKPQAIAREKQLKSSQGRIFIRSQIELIGLISVE
jgi:putative endonuclease